MKTETLSVLNKIGLNPNAAGTYILDVIGESRASYVSVFGLVRFNTSGILNKTKVTVTAATFGMLLDDNNSAEGNIDIYLKRSLRAWTTTATRDRWNGSSSSYSWQSSCSTGSLDREDANTGYIIGIDRYQPAGWIDISMDVAKIQEMIRGVTFTDQGFMIWTPTGAYNGQIFTDFRLVLTYTYGSSMQPLMMD